MPCDINMLELREVVKRIELPERVGTKVLASATTIHLLIPQKYIDALTEKNEWKDAYEQINIRLKDDQDGIGMLTCMLLSVSQTYDLYQFYKINDQIFDDTMKCFTRFVKEYFQYTGKDGFDRGFWCGRQISLSLFRLGALEYECVGQDIHIHIPSDTILTKEQCLSSIQVAKDWFTSYFPAYQDAPYVCESWLLSPTLQSILDASSNILQFQSLFELKSWDQEDDSFMMWIFKTTNTQALPTTTSLQKKIKQLIDEKKPIGSAFGILK